MQWFFAHPYHSWERGTNENTNGLIRWYFPKGTDFATISDETVNAVETALNNRPRKRLGWKTPWPLDSLSNSRQQAVNRHIPRKGGEVYFAVGYGGSAKF